MEVEEEGVGLLRDDVELHVRQRQWHSHGHGQDARYNRVALHGVVYPDSLTTTLPRGASAPTLNLTPLLEPSSHPADNDFLWDLLEHHGYYRPANTEETGRLLDQAGDQRFVSHSACHLKFLAEEDPQQLLYEAIMEAMGYSRNPQAFLHLAQRIPYLQLRRRLQTTPPQEKGNALRQILLRVAGFISQGIDGSEEQVLNPTPSSPAPRWHLFRIRPENHPRRRVCGMAVLLAHYWEPGLLAGLERLVREGTWRELERGLTMKDKGKGSRALIGKARAGDTAVNGVLPFFHALGTLRGDDELRFCCVNLFHSYPRLQSNEVTKEMAQRLLKPETSGEINSAQRQQGLIHLHRVIVGESLGVEATTEK